MTTDHRLQKIRTVLSEYGAAAILPLSAGTSSGPYSRDIVNTSSLRKLTDAIDQLHRVESLLWSSYHGMAQHGASCSECQAITEEIASVMDAPPSVKP